MNLFAGMDISDITRRPEASSNLFSGLLQAWGMGMQQANWKAANTLPPARKDAPAPSVPAASPNVTTGPDIPYGVNGAAAKSQPAWMTSGSPFAYDALTGNMGPEVAPNPNQVPQNFDSTDSNGWPVTSRERTPLALPAMSGPAIQDAPAYGFREPANWDGTPKTSWWQESEMKSFRLKDPAVDLPIALLEAQSLPPEEASRRVAQLRASNADWLVSKPIREAFDGVEKNIASAQRYLIQSERLELEKQRVENNSLKAKMALKAETDLLNRIGKLPVDEQVSIATVEDPVAKLKALQDAETTHKARIAAEANARAAAMAKESGQVPSTTRIDANGQPIQSFARPLASASKDAEMPQGIKDQRSEISAKQRLLESELGQLKRAMVNTTGKEKETLKAQVDPLEKQIADLGNQFKFRGTNWGSSATAPMGTNAPPTRAINPKDRLGLFE